MGIFRFTYGYGRKSAIMTTPQIAERTGLSDRTIEKARAQLIKNKVITTEQNGYRGAIEYSINKNYEKWPCFSCGKPVENPVDIKDDYTQKGRSLYPKMALTIPKNG